MTVTISADDPRSIRAIELAAEADYWLTGHNRVGESVYGVPSQSEPGRYYIVTEASCDCPDFEHGGTLCKHILAVRLHSELARAQRHLGAPARRGHLSIVT